MPHDYLDEKCLSSAIWFESRGEPVKARRAVVDTILHRASDSGKTVCEVVAAPGQFPWYKKKGLVSYNTARRELLADTLSTPKVLKDEKFKFFNGRVKMAFMRDMYCKKIGNMFFCKEKNA
jgi:hypothetical protein